MISIHYRLKVPLNCFSECRAVRSKEGINVSVVQESRKLGGVIASEKTAPDAKLIVTEM